MRGIESAVAGLAGRGDTVESVATKLGTDEEVAWFGAHAEEMAWFVLGKNLIGEFDDIGGFFGFSSVEGADAVAVNGLFGHEFGRFAAEIFEQAALDDCIKILFWPIALLGFLGETLMFGDVAREPVMRAEHGLTNEVLVGGIDGLIESHVDIGADLPLSLHGDFRIHANFVAVDVRLKSDAIMIDFDVG